MTVPNAASPSSTSQAASSSKPASHHLSFPDPASERAFLDTVDGEIAFFRSIMRARPIGIHRHFHALAIQNAILRDTGRLVRVETIWAKLRDCWDLDALDSIDLEFQSYVVPPGPRHTSASSTPISIRSPSPSENLAMHPFFRAEFSLPFDDAVQSIIAKRRMRATPSVASSPASSPAPPLSPPTTTTRRTGAPRGRKRKSKLDLAGLVGGDSDSSALTQESGDEGGERERDKERDKDKEGGGGKGGGRESVVTGTDGGTEYADEDGDVDMRDASPARSVATSEAPKPTRGRGRPPTKRGSRGRGGGPGSRGGVKKRKR